jgi:glycerophosphoryl diester phosphodiesterase
MTDHPLRIAHRGMPRLARENTLPSFALALEAGADGIELDVHATRDGVVVVHHDPALTDGTVIADETLRVVRSASDGSVPTLADVRDLIRGRVELFVEIKGAGIERLVLDALRSSRGSFAIHSFDHGMISRIHAIDRSIRLGVLFEEAPADVRALMDSTGARDVWPHRPLITRQLADDVHAGEGRLIAWTVNSASEAQRLARLDVDGLCGDDVRIFAEP